MKKIEFQILDLGHPRRCYFESVDVFKDKWVMYEQDEDDPNLYWKTPMGLKEFDDGFTDLVVFREWTGEMDKNGIKIYDGDIIDVYEGDDFIWRHHVEYHSGGFWVDENIIGAISSFCEIVGNKYENPELLNS